MEATPSNTLYINNINEKIKQDVVKKMLYMVFSQYGRVTDVIAKKGLKLRGQAWVVFEEESSSANALRGKQGFSFYGKPLVSFLNKIRVYICELVFDYISLGEKNITIYTTSIPFRFEYSIFVKYLLILIPGTLTILTTMTSNPLFLLR